MERKKGTGSHAAGSRPDRVTQQSEQSFPASDAPSFAPGAAGAPVHRRTARPAPDKKPEKKHKPGA